jgi:hypothetical protein
MTGIGGKKIDSPAIRYYDGRLNAGRLAHRNAKSPGAYFSRFAPRLCFFSDAFGIAFAAYSLSCFVNPNIRFPCSAGPESSEVTSEAFS